MPDLTIKQRFGKNAYYDADFHQLVIPLTDLEDFDPNTTAGSFTNGLGLDTSGMTATNADEYASKILWAFVQLSKQNQPENNTDDTVGIYITGQGKRNVTRNGVAQLGFQELFTGYTVDPTGLTLDPDLIGNVDNPSEI